jgi:tetratricopeptide (TPR) repeat protein
MIRAVCMSVFATCVLHAFSIAAAAPIQPPTVEDAVEEPERVRPPEIRAAIEQFEQGDAAGAFEKLKTAVVDYPHLPPARVMLANLFFSSGNMAAGRATLEQAAIESPDDPETYLIFGDLLVRERRWTEADAVYRKGEEQWTKFAGDAGRKQSLEARLVSGQAAVSEARGQWELASKLLERSSKLAPKNSATQQRLGRTYFMLKREKDAFAAFEAAAALSPNGPPAAISMAMLHQQQGDAAKGEKWIRYALERNPKKLSTQLGAAQWNWQSGRLDAAAKHAAEALALDSQSLDAQLLAAQAAYYQGQSDVA